MSKLRLLTLVGLLTAALMPLSGCGSECAEGTTDQDGQCVVAANGCAAGTALRNGECVLDTTGCGEGTRFSEEESVCIPAEGTCDETTLFDEATGTCIPNTGILCGSGTTVGDDGWCVPSEEACGDTALLDESGRCVIAAAACGEGTELDPNTNECLLVSDACGAGTALDSESSRCVPTEEICETGTQFDPDSGLCLNDSCHVGDLLIDGVCMTPAEDIAADPDIFEAENNDPSYDDGVAESLQVPLAGDPAYSFVGTIGAPSDLDGDGGLDQDLDVYEFEAEQGEWYQIMVQSTGLEAPAFIVEGPNDYVRYSPVNHARHAVRTIVTPEAGVYQVTVLPSLALQSGEPMGSDDWTYVGTLEQLDAPTTTAVDISGGSAQLSGDFTNLRDNYFEVTGLQSGQAARLRVDSMAEGANGIIQVWSSPTVLESSSAISQGSSVELSSNGSPVYVLVDWTSLRGTQANFELSASLIGGEKVVTVAPDGVETLYVTAEAGDTLHVKQVNGAGASMEVTITDPVSTEFLAPTELASDAPINSTVEIPGEYTVTFRNTSDGNVDATLTAKTLPPLGMGQLPVGVERTSQLFTLPEDDTEPVDIEFSVAAGSMVRIGQTNDDDEEFAYDILDANGSVVSSEGNFYTTDLSENYSDPTEFNYFYAENGGTYTFRAIADSYHDTTNVKLTLENLGQLMTDVGEMASGDTHNFSHSTPLQRNEMRFFKINTSETGMLLMDAITPNREDIDVYIYEGGFDDAPGSSESPIDEQYTYEVDSGISYIMLHAWAPLPSYIFNLGFNAPTPTAPDFVSTPALHIPDADFTGVSDTLTVTGCTAVDSVQVYFDVTHDYTYDLFLTLTSPNGTSVPLLTEDYLDDNPSGWLPQEFNVDGNLNVLENERGNGEWTLTAYDDYSGTNDTGGTLEEWGLTLTCK